MFLENATRCLTIRHFLKNKEQFSKQRLVRYYDLVHRKIDVWIILEANPRH